MLNKKRYKKVIWITILIILTIIGGCVYFYRKPVKVHKSYNGVIKDIKTEKLIGNVNIKLDINYQKAYTIKKFKCIDRLYGIINIDGKDYEVQGMTIVNKNGNYIGATASENNKSKYHIFLLDDLEFILIGEVENDEFIKQIVAPAKNESDFNKVIQKLP